MLTGIAQSLRIQEPEEGPAPQRGNHVDTHKETGHVWEGERPLGPGAVTWASGIETPPGTPAGLGPTSESGTFC